jgi:hypothetical protein
MYATIFKIAWPYLQRFLAGKAVEYLQERRERRLGLSEEEAMLVECPPCPPCPPAEAPVTSDVNSPTMTDSSSSDAIWFALSGILLGSAFSVMLYIIVQDAEPRPQT